MEFTIKAAITVEKKKMFRSAADTQWLKAIKDGNKEYKSQNTALIPKVFKNIWELDEHKEIIHGKIHNNSLTIY